MNFIQKAFLIVLGLAFGFSLGVNAPTARAAGTPQSYVLEIIYKNGSFSMPEDEGRIDPSTQPFVEATPKNYPLFSIDLYDASGKILKSAKIDQKTAFAKLVDAEHDAEDSWVKIVAPYDKNASHIVIKNDLGEQQFDGLLYNTTQLRETDSVLAPTNSNAPTTDNIAQPSSSSTTWILILLIAALLVVGGAIAWFFLKNRSNGN
jgi:hypothetical protein